MSLITFTRFMEVFKAKAAAGNDLDRELAALFDKHTAYVGPHFESCRPEEEWAQRYKFEGLASHWHGPSFHKGFRSYDVIEDNSRGKTDARVWQLISESAPAFWAAHHELFNYQVKVGS